MITNIRQLDHADRKIGGGVVGLAVSGDDLDVRYRSVDTKDMKRGERREWRDRMGVCM